MSANKHAQKQPVYHMQQLNPSHLFSVMALQELAIYSLGKDKENALIAKSSDQFVARMTDLGKMFGVFVQKKGAVPVLVAYGMLALPQPNWPVADMVLPQESVPFDPSSLSVIQSSVVHPLHRGKGLHNAIIKKHLDESTSLGRAHVMGEIVSFNPASLKGFLKAGFCIVTACHDPDDHCPLLFAYKNIRKPAQTPVSKDSLWIDPEKDFIQLKKLLNEGHKGTAIKKVGTAGAYAMCLALDPQ